MDQYNLSTEYCKPSHFTSTEEEDGFQDRTGAPTGVFSPRFGQRSTPDPARSVPFDDNVVPNPLQVTFCDAEEAMGGENVYLKAKKM